MGITGKIYEIWPHEFIYGESDIPDLVNIRPVPVGNGEDFGLLPGNISISQLVIETGVIFYKWLHDIGFYDYRVERSTGATIDDSRLDTDLPGEHGEGVQVDDHERNKEMSPYYIPLSDTDGYRVLDPYTQIVYMKYTYDENGTVTGSKPVEIPQFYPVSSDNMIMSLVGGSETVSEDSPHIKIPMFISARLKRREPASMGGNSQGHNNKFFSGLGKEYGYRNMGHFTDPNDPNRIYEKLIRRWESIVEYTFVARSEVETYWLEDLFERFLEDCEGAFLKAGLDKTVPAGVLPDKQSDDTPLAKAGMHYIRYYQWYRTQQTRVKGPVRPISDIEIGIMNK